MSCGTGAVRSLGGAWLCTPLPPGPVSGPARCSAGAHDSVATFRLLFPILIPLASVSVSRLIYFAAASLPRVLFKCSCSEFCSSCFSTAATLATPHLAASESCACPQDEDARVAAVALDAFAKFTERMDNKAISSRLDEAISAIGGLAQKARSLEIQQLAITAVGALYVSARSTLARCINRSSNRRS